MLSVSHAVTGAFIAVAVPSPAVSIPLILTAHYLQDAVPHWDAGTGLSTGKKSPRTALLHEIPDLLLAGIAVLIFFPLPTYDLSALPELIRLPQIWGAFLALVPDFLEAPRNFLKKEPGFLKPVNRFHKSFHHSIPNIPSGLAPQILTLALLWYFR